MRKSVPRRSLVRRLSGQIWQACQRWNNSECVDLSAAFAYFVLQSFFPLLLIALSVAARVFGRTDSLDSVLASVTQFLPPSATSLVDSTLRGLVEQGFGAGILGVVVLLLTASNAYLTLQRGADRLWSEILPEPEVGLSWVKQVVQFCRTRVEAFLTVFAISILIVFQQLVLSVGQLPEDILGNFGWRDSWFDGICELQSHSSPRENSASRIDPVVDGLVASGGVAQSPCSSNPPNSWLLVDRIWTCFSQ